MLEFTKRKFQSLPKKNQYKKLSDLLKHVLVFFPYDWQKYIKQYNEMAGWLNLDEKKLDENSLNSNQILDYYSFMRNSAGLGAENSLLNKFTFTDLKKPRSHTVEWSLLLHNIRSGYNVGSAIRCVDCFGLSKVHVSGYTPDTNNKSLKSAAMGSENWVSFMKWKSPFDCINSFSDEYTIVALETDPDSVDVQDFNWPKKGLIIVGNEELGIPNEILGKVNNTVQIEMFGRKSSLNVSNAISISLFQLRKYLT